MGVRVSLFFFFEGLYFQEKKFFSIYEHLTGGIIAFPDIVPGMHPVGLHVGSQVAPLIVLPGVDVEHHVVHRLRNSILPLKVYPGGEMHEPVLKHYPSYISRWFIRIKQGNLLILFCTREIQPLQSEKFKSSKENNSGKEELTAMRLTSKEWRVALHTTICSLFPSGVSFGMLL